LLLTDLGMTKTHSRPCVPNDGSHWALSRGHKAGSRASDPPGIEHMFNTCPGCGQYSVEKTIDPAGPFAVCPFCGHRHRFLQLPLFVVTGASATGKTTVCLALQSSLPECVVLECDVLWRPEFADPENDYRAFRDVWLRLAKNIGQAGRPVVLCGSAIPAQYEPCPERRYFITWRLFVTMRSSCTGWRPGLGGAVRQTQRRSRTCWALTGG
jgi:hypothetical protein